MITVRSKTFETNSSSSHSLIIGTESDIEAFINGKLWYCDYTGEKDLMTTAEALDFLKRKATSELPEEVFIKLETYVNDASAFASVLEEAEDEYECWPWDYIANFDHWNREREYEDGNYTTPGGEKIAWVASYGYDY